VPRKTPAQRAAASAAYHRKQIQDAHRSGEIDAPLTAAMRWLYAALAQQAMDNPSEAAGMYGHATDQIAQYAESVQQRTATAQGKQ